MRVQYLKRPYGYLRYVTSHEKTYDTVIYLVQGRHQSCEKYQSLMLALPTNCLAVTWDLYGQGASDGRGFDVDGECFVDDFIAIFSLFTKKSYFIVAHSTGALISLSAIASQKWRPQALILLSPFFGVANLPLPRLFLKALVYGLCKLGLGHWHLPYPQSDFEGNDLTHSLEAFERTRLSGYLAIGPTLNWLRWALSLQDEVCEAAFIARLLPLKVHCLMAGDDRVVSNQATQRWLALTNKLDALTITGAYHELLGESKAFRLATEIAVLRVIAGKTLLQSAVHAREPEMPTS
jgi:lysophospholipase